MAHLTGKERFRFILGEQTHANQKFVKATPSLNSDNDGIASNGLWTAVPWAGQGSFALFTSDSYRIFDQAQPLVKGHQNNVADVAFYPFRNDLLASCSADMTIKLWQCPKEDMKENVTNPLLTLKGHQKGVTNIRWHNMVENCLASGGIDRCVKIWDVENQKCTMNYDKSSDQIYSLRWNPSGNMLASMEKNRKLSLYDPRDDSVVKTVTCHEGPK